MLCPTVQWLVNAELNCPMAGQLSVQMSNAQTVFDTSKCNSENFAHSLSYVVNVENCHNFIEMYQCPPIAGRRS